MAAARRSWLVLQTFETVLLAIQRVIELKSRINGGDVAECKRIFPEILVIFGRLRNAPVLIQRDIITFAGDRLEVLVRWINDIGDEFPAEVIPNAQRTCDSVLIGLGQVHAELAQQVTENI